MQLGGSSVRAIELKTYARRVLAALRRLRRSRPVWRERALGRLDE
jgi:hypothetical protein